MATTVLTPEDNNLFSGTPANDVVRGTSGNDKIYGGVGSDRIDGGAGNDLIMGGKGVDYLYGGAGNDTFAFAKNDFDTSLGHGAQDYVWDFEGAGGWSATGNDFLRFTGFGLDSTFEKNAALSAQAEAHNPGLSIYTLTDSATGIEYSIAIKSVNGAELVKGDFGFY
jgi:Ca2+-binding RTX toxin-like protein